MAKFDEVGPYYALAVQQTVLNTQGGPRRNARAEVVDPDNQPIPHLYSAGELGGVSAGRYQAGENIAECLISGKIAGQNAAWLKEKLQILRWFKLLNMMLIVGHKKVKLPMNMSLLLNTTNI